MTSIILNSITFISLCVCVYLCVHQHNRATSFLHNIISRGNYSNFVYDTSVGSIENNTKTMSHRRIRTDENYVFDVNDNITVRACYICI